MTEVLPSALEDLGFTEFTAENLDELLPKIISTICEDSNNPNFLQLLTLVFGHLAAQLEIDVLDSKLLKRVLPHTRSSFDSSLVKIKSLLEDSDELDEETAIHISESLQVCLDILSGYGELIEILSKEVLQAKSVESLNRNLPPILVEAFSHCKDSESKYGPYFEESTTILTTFFRKSYEIQTKYYKLVEERINFCTKDEGDLECLLLVMEASLRMAAVIVSLDMKTSADQWRLYGKLYSNHAADLRHAVDTSEPLCLLISNFEQILSALTDSQESATEKQLLRLLKIANFLLKLIIRLCELSECNFRRGWDQVMQLLLLLNSCSRCQAMPEKFTEDLRRYIVVGAAPLLAVLVKEDHFYKAFVSQKDDQSELSEKQTAGLFFLCLSLMKLTIEKKIPACWNSVPFVETVLDSYDSCGLLVDLNTQFEGNDAYSSTVSVVTAFMVATANDSTLPNHEKYLITRLFKSHLHTAILASDIFCLIGRLTSDEYCLHLTTCLCEALRVWPSLSTYRPEYVVVGTLVRRLWCLLSVKSRDVLSSNYASPESRHVCYWFDGGDPYCKSVGENFVDFVRNPSPAKYVTMMVSPPYIGKIQTCHMDCSSTFSHVLRIIHYVGSFPGNEGDERIWCQKLLLYSLKMMMSIARIISLEELIQVLEKLKTVAENDDKRVLLVVSWFLAKSSSTLLEAQPNSRMIRSSAALLIKCLGSEDMTAESLALCALEVLDESPPHKEIVLLVSSHNDRCLHAVNSRLRRTSAPQVSSSLAEVVTSLPRLPHICRRTKPVCLDEVPPPAKKPKTCSVELDSITACLERLMSETKTLKDLHERFGLPDELKQQLNCVISELSSL